MKSEKHLLSELRQFTGTTQWYRHSLFPNFLYTDGIAYLAEQAGAYWLIDAIFSYQIDPKIHKHEYQTWKILVNVQRQALIIGDDGNGNIIGEFSIPYTDFPFTEFKIWFVNNVLLLPTEY